MLFGVLKGSCDCYCKMELHCNFNCFLIVHEVSVSQCLVGYCRVPRQLMFWSGEIVRIKQIFTNINEKKHLTCLKALKNLLSGI